MNKKFALSPPLITVYNIRKIQHKEHQLTDNENNRDNWKKEEETFSFSFVATTRREAKEL